MCIEALGSSICMMYAEPFKYNLIHLWLICFCHFRVLLLTYKLLTGIAKRKYVLTSLLSSWNPALFYCLALYDRYGIGGIGATFVSVLFCKFSLCSFGSVNTLLPFLFFFFSLLFSPHSGYLLLSLFPPLDHGWWQTNANTRKKINMNSVYKKKIEMLLKKQSSADAVRQVRSVRRITSLTCEWKYKRVVFSFQYLSCVCVCVFPLTAPSPLQPRDVMC